MLQAMQICQHFGGDSGRGNVRNPTQQHGSERRPAKQPSGEQARREVQREIGGARGKALLEAFAEFLARVFEP